MNEMNKQVQALSRKMDELVREINRKFFSKVPEGCEVEYQQWTLENNILYIDYTIRCNGDYEPTSMNILYNNYDIDSYINQFVKRWFGKQ